jgi:disulfide bond formation protein DsbB
MKPLRSATRVGTIVAAVIALLPYLNDFFITAYLAGAFAAVWFAIRIRHASIHFKEGAQLGFLSGFYGLLAASGIYDFVWQTLHYRLWKVENAERTFALLGEMLENLFRPSFWLLLGLQIILAAICAGAFGAPAGLLAVKLFQRSERRAPARP